MKVVESIAEFFGLRTDTAEMKSVTQSVITSLSLRNLAYYIASSYISNALSKCEFKTYENGKAVKGELYYALNVSPNPNQNGSEFVNLLMENLLYESDALIVQPSRARNHFYVADSFNPDRRPLRENIFKDVTVEGETLRKSFRASEVCYFKLESKRIRSLVNSMYADFGKLLGIAMQSYTNASGDKFTFRRNAAQGGTGKDVKESYQATNDMLKDFLKNPNAILPLYNQQELTRIAPNPNASSKDVIDLRKDIFEMTAGAFHIPESMMYGNMTNANDIMNQFITFGVDPWAQMISDVLTGGFYDFVTWNGGENYIRVDTSHISHVDVFQMADKIEKLISSGYSSIDEVKLAVGDDPLNTDFSQAHWMTKNYALIQTVLNELSDSMS